MALGKAVQKHRTPKHATIWTGVEILDAFGSAAAFRRFCAGDSTKTKSLRQ